MAVEEGNDSNRITLRKNRDPTSIPLGLGGSECDGSHMYLYQSLLKQLPMQVFLLQPATAAPDWDPPWILL